MHELGFPPSITDMNQRLEAQSVTTSIEISNVEDQPDHLLVLVHGILAGPSDWNYAEAELKKRLGRNFLIFASSSNTYTKTFGGVDGAGKRLAEEIREVVRKVKSLKKISFIGHSLGGVIARYAIAVLYSRTNATSFLSNSNLEIRLENSEKGMICGLDPINFITLASPHLGLRGNNQLPFLFGVQFLEKLAPPVAWFLTGRTGSQMYLTDGKPKTPPLLLRMASDCKDGKFISALGAFKCRILYANVSHDYVVGWRTSSIRRETELVKPPRRSLVGYKHVVDVEYCPPVSSDGPHFPPKAVKAKETAQQSPNTQNSSEYYEIMEDEMIRGLQRLGWKKVDVSFHSSIWAIFAHNNIHVKNEWFHNSGAGVVAHVADSLKKQEKQHQFPSSNSTFISASL